MPHPFRAALIRLQRVTTCAELGEVIVDQMRRVTGFERVLFYRFHEDDHGSVDAEAKEPHRHAAACRTADEPARAGLGAVYDKNDLSAEPGDGASETVEEGRDIVFFPARRDDHGQMRWCGRYAVVKVRDRVAVGASGRDVGFLRS